MPLNSFNITYSLWICVERCPIEKINWSESISNSYCMIIINDDLNSITNRLCPIGNNIERSESFKYFQYFLNYFKFYQ